MTRARRHLVDLSFFQCVMCRLIVSVSVHRGRLVNRAARQPVPQEMDGMAGSTRGRTLRRAGMSRVAHERNSLYQRIIIFTARGEESRLQQLSTHRSHMQIKKTRTVQLQVMYNIQCPGDHSRRTVSESCIPADTAAPSSRHGGRFLSPRRFSAEQRCLLFVVRAGCLSPSVTRLRSVEYRLSNDCDVEHQSAPTA